MACHHRLQARDAHLDRLLHHIVEARALERRKQVMQVVGRGLRPGLGLEPHRHGALSRDSEAAPPFPVAAIEQQDRVVRLKPQHMGEIMALRLFERDRRAGLQRLVDMKAGAAEIVAGHGVWAPKSPVYRPVHAGASAGLPRYRRIPRIVIDSKWWSGGGKRDGR